MFTIDPFGSAGLRRWGPSTCRVQRRDIYVRVRFCSLFICHQQLVRYMYIYTYSNLSVKKQQRNGNNLYTFYEATEGRRDGCTIFSQTVEYRLAK